MPHDTLPGLATTLPAAPRVPAPAPRVLGGPRRRPYAFAAGVLLLSLLMVTVSGCKSAPVMNVTGSPIGGRYTLDQIADKVVRVCKRRGWRARLVAPGRVEAMLNIRTHMAKVDITFDRTSYSITYRDSQNLGYNGSTIHHNYNKWVQNLDSDLRVELNF